MLFKPILKDFKNDFKFLTPSLKKKPAALVPRLCLGMEVF